MVLEPYFRFAVPEMSPVDVGANFTERLQLSPAASVAGQSFVCVKPAVVEMLLTVREVACLLVNVAVCTALVLPRAVVGKESDVGAKRPAPSTPFPLRGT